MKANMISSIGLLFSILSMAALGFENAKPRQDELRKLSAKELVQLYVRLDPIGDKRRGPLKEAINAKDPNEVFGAIAEIIDQYDPGNHVGKWRNKSADAYWAVGLLVFIDENQVRARGMEGGRKAIASFERMLDRMKQAGYANEKAEGLNARYRGQMMEFQALGRYNAQDFHIAAQLKEEYQIEISHDELGRFSDFLTAKDPRYVAWSKSGIVSKKPLRYRFLDMRPYYQAYVEYQKTGSSNPQ